MKKRKEISDYEMAVQQGMLVGDDFDIIKFMNREKVIQSHTKDTKRDISFLNPAIPTAGIPVPIISTPTIPASGTDFTGGGGSFGGAGASATW